MAASATSLDMSTPRGHLHENQRPHYIILASQPTTTSAYYQLGVRTMVEVTGVGIGDDDPYTQTKTIHDTTSLIRNPNCEVYLQLLLLQRAVN